MTEKYELEKAIIEKIDEDILVTKYKQGYDIELEDAEVIDRTHYEMSQGRDVFTIVDMAGVENRVTKKAQEFYTKKAKMIPQIKAVGLIMDGLANRMVSKFYMQLYKPYYPTKIFKSRNEAIKWFAELRKD